MARPGLYDLPTKARLMLQDLPPWYWEDEIARAIVTAQANELQRIEDFIHAVRLQMFPQNADDSFGILAMWERLFGLPVKPSGVPLSERQALVLASYRKRQGASGASWEEAVTGALQSNSWSYLEVPASSQITVRFPYVAGGYTSAQALNLLKLITPAHLVLTIGYSQGWLVGISAIGDVL